MKTIHKEEIFQNFKSFLKSKGIELQEGSYSHRIEQGCGLLADSVNVSQEAFQKAKTEVSRGLDKVRQVIHEKTAPKASCQPAGASTQSTTDVPPVMPEESKKRAPKAKSRKAPPRRKP